MSDIRHSVQIVHRGELGRLEVAGFAARVKSLKAQLEEALAADGIAPAARAWSLAGDIRYLGQFHELELPLPMPGEKEWWDAGSIAARFHAAHRKAYGHADEASPVELVNLRLIGLGRLDRPPAEAEAPGERHEPAALDERPAYIDRRAGFQACRHYDRAALKPGALIRGPALIHQLDTTTLVLPGSLAETLAGGVIAIRADKEEPR